MCWRWGNRGPRRSTCFTHAFLSAGRALDKADDNEFVLLEVGDFLAAN